MTTKELIKLFGQPGENQVLCYPAYEMVLGWEPQTTIKKFYCHEKCKASLEQIFKDILEEYGIEEIKRLHLDRFDGCLNVRKIRGGSSWSMHSWGIAVDLDADRNTMKMHKATAQFAKKEYDKFFKIVYENGWYSLGKEKDFDFMHIQMVKP
jgi:hypothetical protein